MRKNKNYYYTIITGFRKNFQILILIILLSFDHIFSLYLLLKQRIYWVG